MSTPRFTNPSWRLWATIGELSRGSPRAAYRRVPIADALVTATVQDAGSVCALRLSFSIACFLPTAGAYDRKSAASSFSRIFASTVTAVVHPGFEVEVARFGNPCCGDKGPAVRG